MISLKSRALRYLSAREHSRSELARKLARHASESDNLDALLDELEAGKFLSEERFAESLVNRRSARFGNNRILHELKGHAITGEALTDIKAGLEQDEVARATEVWRKKFGVPPENASARAKQMRFLQQRGFSHRAIQAALRDSRDMAFEENAEI
jgi:regulatory protein